MNKKKNIRKSYATVPLIPYFPSMVFSAIAWTLSCCAAIFIVSPRYPYYQITELRLVSFSPIKLLLRWVVTCTLEADIEIDNANFVGAEVHSAVMDLYYPDDGVLRYIGDLRDKHTYQFRLSPKSLCVDRIIGGNNATFSCFSGNRRDLSPNLQIYWNNGYGSIVTTDYIVSSNKTCANSVKHPLEGENPMKSQLEGENPAPFYLPPRTKAVMHSNFISIDDMGPRIPISILLEFFRRPFGEVRMLSAGVAHVKTSSGLTPSLPVTVTVLCDHRINALTFPAQIIDRICSPVEISTGWLNKEIQRVKLRKEITKRFDAVGGVLSEFDPLAQNQCHDINSAVEWYDF